MKTTLYSLILILLSAIPASVLAVDLHASAPETADAVLRKEHTVILKVVNALREDVEALRQGETVEPERIRKALDFFENFADACHHRKEERVYFPAVGKEAGAPQHIMISSFLNDHNWYRTLLDQVRAGVENDRVDPSIAEPLAAYLSSVSLHIFRENRCMQRVEPWLSPESEKELIRGFGEIEEDLGGNFHQKYKRLAAELTDA